MKKFLCFLLIIAMSVGLIACKNKKKETAKQQDNDAKTQKETVLEAEEPKKPLGLVTNYASFEAEVSKRIDLSDYNIIAKDERNNAKTYTCTRKEEITLPQQESNFIITADGVPIKMPTNVGDLVSKGFQITEINLQPVSGEVDLKQPCWCNTLTIKNADGNELVAFALSPDKYKSVQLKDCTVSQIDPDLYSGGSDYPQDKNPLVPEMVYFNGITNDATLDDVLSKLGAPSLITYHLATYKGKTTISIIQILYNFQDKIYSGHVYFTIDLLQLSDGSQANMVTDISYIINIPGK